MKNLVFTSAGENSKHLSHWLDRPNERNFDLFVAYYGDEPGQYLGTADSYFARKGSKWQNLTYALEAYSILMNAYDAYFILDDDIELSTLQINSMFQQCHERKLWLCQPAYSRDSYTWWEILKECPDSSLRWTNFVECGPALFSRQAFQRCEFTFSKNISGNGLDLIWPQVLGMPKTRIAVIDEIVCRHPLRESEMDKILARDKQNEEGRLILKTMGWRDFVPTVYGSIPRWQGLFINDEANSQVQRIPSLWSPPSTAQ